MDLNSEKLDPSFQEIYFWNKNDSLKNQSENYSSISFALSKVKEIPVGQAFFVKTSSKPDSVSIVPDLQIHSTSTALKSDVFSCPEIAVTFLNNGLTSSARIFFSNEMTAVLDSGYDVGLFKVAGENALYSRLLIDNSVDFTIQCLPINGMESFIIPLGFDCPKGGDIEFSCKLNSLPQGECLY